MTSTPGSGQLNLDDEPGPDLLVTASIFAGLLAFFASMLVVFWLVVGPLEVGKGRVGEKGTKQLYFGEWNDVILIMADRVEVRLEGGGGFEIPRQHIVNNQQLVSYFRSLAKDQRDSLRKISDIGRKVLLSVQPGAAYNEFWVEATAGEMNVIQITIVRFHDKCLHIDAQGDKGQELMQSCMERYSK